MQQPHLTRLRVIRYHDPTHGECVRLIPADYALDIIQAYSVQPTGCPVSVTRYEMRAYDPTHAGTPQYIRDRNDGYNPIVLADRLCGRDGGPAWMRKAVESNHLPGAADGHIDPVEHP
jgi:hypothetical protein